MMEPQVFFSGAKAVGEFRDGVLRKKVSKRVHLFKKFDAWGFDKKMWDTIFPELIELRVYDEDEEMLYTATIEAATERKIVGEFGGFGPQVFIPRSVFTAKKHVIKKK